MSENWKTVYLAWARKLQNFFSAIILALILPLMPLLFEFYFTSSIKIETWLISATMYSLSISVVSKAKLVFVLGVAVALPMAWFYGIALSQTSPGIDAVVPISVMVIFGVCHLVQSVVVFIFDGESVFPWE